MREALLAPKEGCVVSAHVPEPSPGRFALQGNGEAQTHPLFLSVVCGFFGLNTALDLGLGKPSVASGRSGSALELCKRCFRGKLGKECFSQDSPVGSKTFSF